MEKALKAALVAAGVQPPRHHDADDLRDRLPAGWAVKQRFPGLAVMIFYSVTGRYPEDHAPITGAKAAGARRTAAALYDCVRQDLARRGIDVRDL